MIVSYAISTFLYPINLCWSMYSPKDVSLKGTDHLRDTVGKRPRVAYRTTGRMRVLRSRV